MSPNRWSHLVRHGLLGTSLLAAAPAAAAPCDDLGDGTIVLVLGFDVSPRLTLIGGVEGRYCTSDRSELMMRVEVGFGGARLMGGLRARPFESPDRASNTELLGIEAGGALDLEGRFGAHLALSYGPSYAYLAAQALFPIYDRATQASRVSLVGGLAPWTALAGTVQEGRPLIRDGRVLRPEVITALPSLRSAEARAVRAHFVAAARNEYSSVWTFLRLAAELSAAAAPAALIARALDAADDEVRHAELCARAAGGVALAPLAMHAATPRFSARTAEALGLLAVEAWCEGCLNEGAAAEEARLAAADAQGPARAMLATIARDEAGHAALAWSVLAWIHGVAPAVAAAALARVPSAQVGEAHDVDAALARHGVPTAQVSAAARAHAASMARRGLRELVG